MKNSNLTLIVLAMGLGEVGKRFFKILLIGVLYYSLQIIIEIILTLLFEYSGIKRSEDFSKNTLLISAFLYISWIIIYTKIFLIWAYLLLFIGLKYLFKKQSNGFYHLIACIGSSLLVLFYDNNASELFSFLTPTIIGNILIIVTEKFYKLKNV